MKKMAFVLSIIASAFVLASCASKGTDTTTMSSDTDAQAAPVKHHHHHHDYKGEAASK